MPYPDIINAAQAPSRVQPDLTFRLDGLFGPQLLQVFGAMRPWVVKAIRYRGEDVFGRLVELRNSTDPNDLVVVLTNRAATVSGRVDFRPTRRARTRGSRCLRSMPPRARPRRWPT
jgi:hypothetical protein